MKVLLPRQATQEGPSEESTLSSRSRALFHADWTEVSFLHYEVDMDALQEVVPFALDSFGGKAHISLVAFTMRRFRLSRGGKALAWITDPLATQRFLNLRTYVRGPRGPGIFFLREWLDHPLAVRLGRLTYGLPYRSGRPHYQNDSERVVARIEVGGTTAHFAGTLLGPTRRAAPHSLEHFLVERYLAYTAAGIRPLAFHVSHDPWILRDLAIEGASFGSLFGDLRQAWTGSLRFAGAVHSKGTWQVRMGRPHRA